MRKLQQNIFLKLISDRLTFEDIPFMKDYRLVQSDNGPEIA